MDRAVLHDKAELIYDYHKCYEWCNKDMARPSDEWEHTGTWACNGEFHWRALSNGKDPHNAKYPIIPQKKREWRAVEGSDEFALLLSRRSGSQRAGTL